MYNKCVASSVWGVGVGDGGARLVLDRDAQHRPLARNATESKVGQNCTFCQKYRGRNVMFSSFLLKYRGQDYANFPEA